MMKKEEFLKKVEELKKVNTIEPAVEIDNNMVGLLYDLRKFLESKIMFKWDWNYKYNPETIGFLDGLPYAIFNRPAGNGGILVTPDKIVRYSKDNVDLSEYNHYEEYNYDGNYSQSITGKPYNQKSFSVCFAEKIDEDRDVSYYYGEETKSSFTYADEIEFAKDNMVARDLLKKLVSLGLAARMTGDVEKDWCYNSYEVHTYNSLHNDVDNVSHNAHCYANYSSIKHYLEGGLPYNIHFTLKENKETAEISKYFILLKDGRYVDTELYSEKGLEGSIVTMEQINEMLQKVNLTLAVGEKLKEFIINDGIPSLDVEKVLSAGKGRK